MSNQEFDIEKIFQPGEERRTEARARIGALADLGIIRTPSQIRQMFPETFLLPEPQPSFLSKMGSLVVAAANGLSPRSRHEN